MTKKVVWKTWDNIRFVFCVFVRSGVSKYQILTNTGQNCNLFNVAGATFSKLARDWTKSNATPPVIGRTCPVDRRWIPWESGTLEGKGKKLQPHNYTMRLLWLGLGVISGVPFETRNGHNHVNNSPRTFFTMVPFGVPACKHSSRRSRTPAVTPDNYTGNFVCTTAVSMDANRSASSLLPQSALFETNFTWSRSGQVALNRECPRCVLSPCERFMPVELGKSRVSTTFVGLLRTTAWHAVFEMTSDPKTWDIQKHTAYWSVWSASPSHQNKAEGSTSPISAF